MGSIPAGESVSDFKNRCCEAFREVMTAIPENTTIAFVVHGGAIMAILETYCLPKQDFYHYHIKNCSGFTCDYMNGHLYISMKLAAD